MMRKFILLSLLILALVAMVWLHPRWHFVKAFPDIISSYYAKEFCSCYFVVGNPEEYCHDYVEQWLPINDFELNTERKWVQVSGLGRTQKAMYFGKRQGCGLQPYGK